MATVKLPVIWRSKYRAEPYRTVITINVSDSDVHHIEIALRPTKLVYNDGDTIDFSGIVVKAYKEDGSLSDKYPNGIIPIEELAFPVTIAKYE